eukprot:765826-Hanusia_phi.AAC.7
MASFGTFEGMAAQLATGPEMKDCDAESCLNPTLLLVCLNLYSRLLLSSLKLAINIPEYPP